MNNGLSTYLDFIRLAAAMVVFLTHAGYDQFTSGWLLPVGQYGHDAVVIFFVLSGFVIAHVVEHKETTPGEFFLARLARLWSVVMPALVLTLVLDYIGSRIDYSVYAGPWFHPDNWPWRLLANLFFINELWFASIRPLSNGPFWSIGYEFWYYVAFAALTFPRPPRRIWLFVGCALLMGPKILALLPVWLLGVWACRQSRRVVLSPWAGWLFFLAPWLLYVMYRGFGGNAILAESTQSLFGEAFVQRYLDHSQEIANDYVVGCLVAMHFVGATAVSQSRIFLAALVRHEKPIRFFANYTFTIYLLHFPLLLFFAAIIHNDPHNPVHQFVLLAGTILAILLVGTYTERKKRHLRNCLRGLSRRLQSGLG